jgi:hypothetical protein
MIRIHRRYPLAGEGATARGLNRLFELLAEFGELLLQSFHLGAQESDVGFKSGDSFLAWRGFFARIFFTGLDGRDLSR